jgi:SpoVK/Ycf46/Vps4 family AAA+-type ATPase
MRPTQVKICEVDAAKDGAAVLLFDEADTLFGKRSEVRDSRNRYANLEVGYMLQHMESFRDLAILTPTPARRWTRAFLRRLRVVVTFPTRTGRRERPSRLAFPAAAPMDELDPARLARWTILAAASPQPRSPRPTWRRSRNARPQPG